jgi:hypothetical protein
VLPLLEPPLDPEPLDAEEPLVVPEAPDPLDALDEVAAPEPLPPQPPSGVKRAMTESIEIPMTCRIQG